MLLAAALAVAMPAHAELVQVPTRPGVTLPVSIEPPTGPAKAWALLFVGGDGLLNLGPDGAATSVLKSIYIIRSRQHLQNAGIGVVVVDAPSDQRGGMDRVFRRSPEHLADIVALTRAIRQRFSLPVWIVGHSNGGISAGAAAGAPAGPERADGLVMTSATNVQNRQNPGNPLQPVAFPGPVLVVSHQDDECKFSPPDDGPKILAAYPSARVKAQRVLRGGSGYRGDPCHGASAHSFQGIEAEVMALIAGFIVNPQ